MILWLSSSLLAMLHWYRHHSPATPTPSRHSKPSPLRQSAPASFSSQSAACIRAHLTSTALASHAPSTQTRRRRRGTDRLRRYDGGVQCTRNATRRRRAFLLGWTSRRTRIGKMHHRRDDDARRWRWRYNGEDSESRWRSSSQSSSSPPPHAHHRHARRRLTLG